MKHIFQKKWRHGIILVLASCFLIGSAVCAAEPESEGEASADGGGWFYEDGWKYKPSSEEEPYKADVYSIDDTYYAFDENGIMQTGWYKDINDTYWYFGTDGSAYNGWILSNGSWYYIQNGEMYTEGLLYRGNNIYYLGEDGVMKTGWVQAETEDWNGYENITVTNWYYFDGNGAAHKGWLNIGGTWYYLNPYDGTMYCDDVRDIDNIFYGFDKTGAMITGWYKFSDNNFESWYYFDGNGAAHKGWLNDGGTWYYLSNDGYMYADEVTTPKGSDISYGFDKTGAMVIGWYNFGNDTFDDWYYFDGNGAAHEGWLNDGGTWYYLFDGWLNPYDTWQFINGSWYAFNESGAMRTNWYQETWTYEDETGETKTELGDWYYLGSDGAMRTGWQKINGTWYYLNGSGVMQTGWLNNGGVWYYLKSDGAMATGCWIESGGKSYYLYGSGAMATNTTIDGKYRVDINGAWDGKTL